MNRILQYPYTIDKLANSTRFLYRVLHMGDDSINYKLSFEGIAIVTLFYTCVTFYLCSCFFALGNYNEFNEIPVACMKYSSELRL